MTVSEPTAKTLDEVEALYTRSRYLAADRLLGAHEPRERWRTPRALLIASRLANNLGGRDTGDRLALRAWREARRPGIEPDLACRVAYFHLLNRLHRRGPLWAWEELGRLPAFEGASPARQAELRLARVAILIALRDFDAAAQELEAAEAAGASPRWVRIERADLLRAQDDLQGALALTEQALALEPDYRVAIAMAAQLLHELGRSEEACTRLTEAVGRLEAPMLLVQRAFIESALGRPQAAWDSHVAAAGQLTCLDRRTFEWLCASTSAHAYRAGDVTTSVALAAHTGSPDLIRSAAGVAARPQGRRIELAVPFVRQNNKTCGPATLASICQFHGLPTEQVAIAEEICFDGTTAASERAWAEAQGFAVRELTVTWEKAISLIDRRLPFTLTTRAPTSAHLQAVIGYDERRRTLLVRDPSVAHLVELAIEELLEEQAWVGPRGMVLAPSAEALAGLALEDDALYDERHALELALRKNDREEAQRRLDTLRAFRPNHHVTASAAEALANYDENPIRLRAILEEQLARHAKSTALELSLVFTLRGLERATERRARLEALAKDSSDPLFGRLLADDLLGSAEDAERAARLLRRAIRARPLDAAAYRSLGWLLSEHQQLEPARAMMRFAACLDESDANAALVYFNTCRQLRATDEAIAFLEARVARRGSRFGEPTMTLHQALEALGRTSDALAVLDRGVELRPTDGELLVYSATAHARVGHGEVATQRLAAARPHLKETTWLRAAAVLDMLAGNLANAREKQRQVLVREPLATETLAEILRLTAALADRTAARVEATAAADAYPHHAGFARLLLDWTDDEGEPGLAAIRRCIDVEPESAWAWRELAVRLGRRHRFEEAWAALGEAGRRAPDVAEQHHARALIRRWQGDRAEARRGLRRALELRIDNGEAMQSLVMLGETPAERREDLAFIGQELRRQVIFGDCLATYRTLARADVEGQQLLAFLQEAREARRDLPAAWPPAVLQLIELGSNQEAARLAQEFVGLFPLRAEAHLTLARVHRACDDNAAERVALREAVALAPDRSDGAKRLAESYERTGDFRAAREELERAIARNPWDISLHGMLAWDLWQVDERKPALARLQLALRLEPDYSWGWAQLASWAALDGATDAALAFARDLAADRPHSPAVHLGLASLLDGDRHFDEKKKALAAAITQGPTLVAAYEELAQLLASVGRFDEARDACAPAALGSPPPTVLRGRAAVIEWQAGQRTQALALMMGIVTDVPDYLFGWNMLSHWHAATGDALEARTATKRAFALAPDRTDIGERLFEQELDAEEYDAAGKTLLALAREQPAEKLRPATFRLALATNDGARALDLLEAMAEQHPFDRADVERASELYLASGRTVSLLQRLEAARKRDRIAPGMAYLWARHSSAPFYTRWRQLARWHEETDNETVAIEATSGYLDRLGEQGLGLELRCFMALSGKRLRRNTRVWASGGYALLGRNLMRLGARWLSDWRGRDGVEAWMLLNVALALRTAGRDEEAREANLAALDLPLDASTASHRCWLAFEATFSEPFEIANRAVASAPSPERPTDNHALALARVALAIRSPDVPAPLREGLILALLEQANALPGGTRIYRRLRQRVVALRRR